MFCSDEPKFVCVSFPCYYFKEHFGSCLGCPRYMECDSCIHSEYDDYYGEYDCKLEWLDPEE